MKYMLHVAFDQVYYDELIPSNPVNGVRLPVPDGPEQRVLRPKEREQVCAHAATIRTFPAQGVILLLTCGLRRGELLGLQWQDVDLENGIMWIRHTPGSWLAQLYPYTHLFIYLFYPHKYTMANNQIRR